MAHNLIVVTVILLLNIVGMHAAVLRWQSASANHIPVGRQAETSRFVQERRNADGVWLDVECDLCKAVVTIIRTLVEANRSKDEIASAVAKVCEASRQEDHRVCLGITNVFKARDCLNYSHGQDFTVHGHTVNPLYLAFLCPKCIGVLLIWRLAFPYNVTRYVQRILVSF